MISADYIIICIYFISMILLSFYLGKGQKNQVDYYIGGRKISWWAVGISTLATQTSAISFISIPAFVSIKNNGGLTWLQYELALPLAMIVVSSLLIPYLRKLKLISLYQYLEQRFDRKVRKTVSGIFLISRALATGVGVYAIALVLSIAINIELWVTISLIGLITIIYDTIGGIKAVIYSDVIQSVILIAGLIFCIIYCFIKVDNFFELLSEFPKQRLVPIDFSPGLENENTISFWPFFLGGIFLYASYYGTDQSQAQRELSASSVVDVNKSLFFNGLARFPLTLLYCLMGISIWVYYYSMDTEFVINFSNNPDSFIPSFILELPVVIRGFLFSAILAAAMSSLDSALNSLSAATVQDFFSDSKKLSKIQYSRMITITWGVLITIFAFFVGDIADTVIESINKIGSAFYGPILGVFLLGILFQNISVRSIIPGIIIGVVINLGLWLFTPNISWMWWNLSGCLVTVFSSILISKLTNTTITTGELVSYEPYVYTGWKKFHSYLVLYFLALLSLLLVIYFLFKD